MDGAEVRSHSSELETEFAPSTVSNLQVVVPCRTSDLTRAALKYAERFAQDLNARVRLLDVHVVPYGVPLDRPTVSPRHRKLRELARDSAVPIFAEVVYARDWEQGLRRSLAPGSLVLMGSQKSWCRSSDRRLTARLRKLGHRVLLIDSETSTRRQNRPGNNTASVLRVRLTR
jgi:hypothetical protein